ncbi:hypothetical protein Pint_21762 [Pistacia integerrima]|uniref:Uncharacterized protein n=1 Tax=Pistacia integerrima TaxID=434235 RepID=A0ACC0XD68_9ROSI|nr:hypothetical protein Pint_21762 [Pistacia integerrima]
MAVHLHFLLLHTIILLVWAIKASAIHCPTSCGNVSEIRYPFGIGEGCYYDEWFAVTCDNSSGSPVPFLSRTNLKLAEDISRRSNGMAIGLSAYVNKLEAENLSRTPFYFSHKLNKFMATGCNSYTTTFKRHQIKSKTRCLPICTCDPAKDKRCYDLMCTISSSHQVFSDIEVPENCTGALMVEQDWLMTNYLANTNPNVLKERELFPVVMEFGRYMGNCNLFCNITSRNDCSKCPRGYKYNSSQKVDGKPTCYPAPPKGPGKNKDIPAIGLCSAFGTLSLSMGARRLYEVR